MYVAARHEGEELLLLDGLVRIKVLSVTGRIVRIGIEAPREVSIERVAPGTKKGKEKGDAQGT